MNEANEANEANNVNLAPEYRGFLVAIEGLDGSGTTSQARLAAANLKRLGIPSHLTREPSDNPIGRLIRNFIVGNYGFDGSPIDPATLALLFAADRLDHLQREVEPQIAQGRVVVSDRWYHSSLAYQSPPGGDLSMQWVREVNVRSRVPDLTIFLRVDPEIAAKRRVAAGRAQELFDDQETQRRVYAGYVSALEFVEERGERVVYLNGEDPVEVVEVHISRLIGGLVFGKGAYQGAVPA